MNKYLYDIITNQGTLSVEDIALRLFAAAFFAIVVYVSYKFTHAGAVYSEKFNITLVTLTILTTMVMTVIGNNVALSLGMVGALSIIRFRTSIKDSRDTVYIFWTIILGICCGVGDYTVAGLGSVIVFIVLLLLGRVKSEGRTLLIICANRAGTEKIRSVLFEYFVKAPIVKAENTTETKVEFIYEISRASLEKSKEREIKLAVKEERQQQSISDKLYAVGGIDYINIVAQNDEIS